MWRLFLSIPIVIACHFVCGQSLEDKSSPRKGKEVAPEGKSTLFDYDRQLVQEAGIGTDSKSLMEYLRKLSPKELEPVNFPGLFEQLGDKSFEKREEASKKLAAFDLVPSSLIWDALYSSDKEVARRARVLAEKQAKNSNWFFPLAAVRQLMKEKPAGTLELLLRYLPFATWEDLIEEIWYAIDRLAIKNGKIEDAILKALRDPSAARRAVTGCIIGRAGNRDQKDEAKKLLKDSDDLVRLRVAQGFLAAEDSRGNPTLVDLLNHRSPEISWQAEELLHWFGGDGAPKETTGACTEKERKDCAAAWKRWLSASSGNEKDAQTQRKHRRPRLLVIRQAEDFEHSRIWLCGCDGVPRWEFKGQEIVGLRLVSPQHLLVVHRLGREEKPVDRFLSQKLNLVDLSGKSKYEKDLREFAYFHSLPNATIAINEVGSVTLLSGTDRIISRYPLVESRLAPFPDCFGTYGNSIFFALNKLNQQGGNPVSQMDLKNGKIIATIQVPHKKTFWDGVTDAPSLIANVGDLRSLREFTLDGKEAQGPINFHSICTPLKLHNGDLVAADEFAFHPRIFAQDKDGKVFWEAFTSSRPRPVEIMGCYGLVSFGFSPEKYDLDDVEYRVQVLKGTSELVCSSPLARDWSLDFIGKQGDKAVHAIPVLVSLLGDSNKDVQIKASDLLIRLCPMAIPSISNLLKSKDPQLRLAATKILGVYCRQKNTLLPELQIACKDDNPSVRGAYYESLGWFTSHSENLLKLLSKGFDDNNPSVKVKAIEAAERWKGDAKMLIPRLVCIVRGPDKVIHRSAVRALGAIGGHDQENVKIIVECLRNGASEGSQIGAAQAIAEIGLPASDAIPKLMEIVRNAPKHDPPSIGRLEGSALYALEKMGPKAEPVLPLVVNILKNRNYSNDERLAAVQAIREIGVPTKSTIRALEDIVGNEDEPGHLRRFAAECLYKLRKEN